MIIKRISEDHIDPLHAGKLPDLFASEKEKQKKDYIKKTLDYFEMVARNQVRKNSEGFVRNYSLVKGDLTTKDYYLEDEELSSFASDLMLGEPLPAHVKHYSILTPPINIMVGELRNRPDYSKVKAYDEESQSEELEYKTNVAHSFIRQRALEMIRLKAAMQGIELPQEDEEQLTIEKVEEHLVNYTSLEERWGNKVLESCKVEFNMKELSEEGFRDLIIGAREYFHIYEDNSRMGFNVEVANGKYVWVLKSQDKKYTSDAQNSGKGAYAAGLLRVMEISEIIQRFNLTKEEIDHLREYTRDFPDIGNRPSNFNSDVTGVKSIKYHPYSPALENERLLQEMSLNGESTELIDYLNGNTSLGAYDNKFLVLESYHLGKKKIGRVRYIDEDGELQTELVDEDYEEIPTQVGEVEWGYINQWYKGLKIGEDIYYLEPLKILPYNPIIGVMHETKNIDDAKSLVDLLKPFQILYNICMNQLYTLLDKEIGNVALFSLRHVPRGKDDDERDAIDLWEEEARAKGIMFLDDSPKNLKAPSSFNQFKNIDLTKSAEIQSRYNLAVTLKLEAWELVGITRDRAGRTTATQTATATQNSMSQSYAQTEPWFAQHEYLMNQVYQGILDAAKYVAISKPTSTINYINNEGDESIIRINTDSLTGRDLKVFVTSRAEDQRTFEELRQFSHAILQNGGDIYDVSVLYTTNSVRQMKKVFKTLKEERQAFQEREQQLRELEIQNAREMEEARLAQEREEAEIERINENYNKELDRINKKEVALIQSFNRQENNLVDSDNSGVPDILEVSRLAADQAQVLAANSLKEKEIQQRKDAEDKKYQAKMEELKVARENMKNDKEIALINARNRKNKSK